MERLDKIISATGKKSRREVKELVRQGRVTACGRAVLRPEEKYSATDEIFVDGQSVRCDRFTYIMLHKPGGLLSATEDKRQRTVLDLLPEQYRKQGLFPVGRLDKDTVGFTLITDDGDFGHKVISPKSLIEKEYLVTLDKPITAEDITANTSITTETITAET